MKCTICGGPADQEDECSGCGALICESCDETVGIVGPHEIIAHSRTCRPIEPDDPSPESQRRALDLAWREGCARAKSPCGRIRTAPIPPRRGE